MKRDYVRISPRPDAQTVMHRFDRVYEVIDGRQAVRGHGPGDMPVWGGAYSLLSWQIQNHSSASKDQESFTRGRIIALIGYIYTLQAK